MRILVSALIVLGTATAFAGELDNEKQVTNNAERVKDLPATLVMRKNEKTGAVEVVHLTQQLQEKQINDADLSKLPFKPVEANKVHAQKKFDELDSDNSRESWYFYYGYYGYPNYYGYPGGCCYNYYYYPTYTYYGYNYYYYPYYNYYWGGYNYWYYRPY